MTVLGHVGDGNLHVNAKYSPPADKHEEMKEIIYSITADFGGSISAEHGIGIAQAAVSEAQPHRRRRSRPCAR